MQFAPPSPEELVQLRAAHVHRHPQPAKFPVLAEHGERVKLPFLLGNPSGACTMPHGARVKPVWAEIVRGMATSNLDSRAVLDPLAKDCILWPDPGTFAAWCERWPGLAGDVALGALRMVGGLVSQIVEPAAIEEPHSEVEAALEAHPRAVWRRLMPPSAIFDVIIDAPASAAYDAFSDAIRRPDEDAVQLTRDFASGQLVACFAGVKAVTAGDVFDRYPGLTIFVAAQARRLAQTQGEVELGEW